MCKAVIMVPPHRGVDLSALRDWGQIEYVFPNAQDEPDVYNPESYIDRAAEWFEQNFDPDNDYFVFVGPSVPTAYGFYSARREHEWNLKCLVYNSRMQAYELLD